MAVVTYPKTLTAGAPENVNDLNSNLTALTAQINGSLDAANVTGAVFFEQYKRVFHTDVGGITSLAAGSKYFGNSSVAVGTSGSSNWTTGLPVFYLTATEYAVSGKTTKLLTKVSYASNATAAGVTLTFGLYPLTVAGGAGLIVPTLGTVTSGSTVALASPSASTVTTGTSGDFTLPSDGAYMVGFTSSGSMAANHIGAATVQLCVRNV